MRNNPFAEIDLAALGVLDAPEIRDAIAAFLGASTGGRVLRIAPKGACVVAGSSARESQVETALSALPFQDESFTRLLCVDTLRHVNDLELFLIEARRVLVPGGGLLSLAVAPDARATRGYLVKAGFSWSESYEAMTVERRTETSDIVEVRVFATSGWIAGGQEPTYGQ